MRARNRQRNVLGDAGGQLAPVKGALQGRAGTSRAQQNGGPHNNAPQGRRQDPNQSGKAGRGRKTKSRKLKVDATTGGAQLENV